jgi:hypothetical protein
MTPSPRTVEIERLVAEAHRARSRYLAGLVLRAWKTLGRLAAWPQRRPVQRPRAA